MTLTIFIVVIALATCCMALKWRRASRALYTASFILFLGVGCGPVPVWLLTDLQSSYAVNPVIEWNQRNAIVLLGAGTEKIPHTDGIEPGLFSYPRIVEAAGLYHACRKTGADCKVVVSGGDARHTGMTEASVYRSILIRLGTDPADLLLEPDSMNTWQNAQFTRALIQRYGATRTVLVSSGLHLRRATMYFAHFGVEATPVRADYLRAVLSPLPLSYNFAVADFALHEYTGIARYRLYNALGWNPARRRPGEA